MSQNSIERLIKENENAFYVFDSGVLNKRVAYLRDRLPENVQLCYAIKANPFITKELENSVERFELCSAGETEIFLSLGIDSRKAVISGVYKTPSAIERLVSDGSFEGTFTAESLSQFELLCSLSEKYGRTLRVLPRLTNDSQFGMNAEDIEDIISKRDEHKNIRIVGMQYFSGTQKTSLKKYKRELEMLDGFITGLRDKFGFECEELEYGTGFPVAYFDGEKLDEEELLGGFSELLGAMRSKPAVILEIGRSIAASCGRYYTHIVDIKCNKGQNYALTDGGMHHIVYYGQYMAMKKPFVSVVGKQATDTDSLWTVCGALCSMNDIIIKQLPLPDIRIGDVLCFENAGAYCMTEGISLLLSRDLPAVYIIKEDGGLSEVRAPFETRELNMPRYREL